MNIKEYKYWIWFSRVEKLTCIQKEGLLRQYMSPENIWNLDKNKIKNETNLEDDLINEILNVKYRKNLNLYEDYINKNQIKIISMFDDDYPDNLKNIYDKPIMLFAKGNVDLMKTKGVAIVGCRDCSEYGKSVAKKIAYDLAKQNITIISGLAKGIDKYAHIGALNANGKTIAVLGNGLDTAYPSENKKLFELILEKNGLIITEYVIGTKPSKLSFPARNRIVSGLSEGVAVVEAKEKSGALITADFALEQGKEVYAVPGNIYSLNSFGTNELIKQGANIVTESDDILSSLT